MRAFYFVLAYALIFSRASAYTSTREIALSFAIALFKKQAIATLLLN
ncbi:MULTISPECIES: hypothetical protein [unclassified Tolypothrix]|nr:MULTISPECIES: hypothetical protein [unclassified Tolypothrix]EKE99815.1 hypothetical protein FDUTEX481_09692 [Tolypothrix sp. PCC 7601]MBE9082752.1 hypothetical protein [Tolypothrix sp. LEGE 11397]UYD25053.1 hypothetical protein HGR01_27180 [Tolypothrix sp. PCC 7712]UYD32709.1 hypothetical protein HG267_27445 [Tolypothrix sp. PCC 7601]